MRLLTGDEDLAFQFKFMLQFFSLTELYAERSFNGF